MGKCHFKATWLDKVDDDGHKLSMWAKKKSDTELFCGMCMTIVNITKGFQAVHQHYVSKKHKENARVKLAPSQLHMTAVGGNSNHLNPVVTSTDCTLQMYAVKDSASIAELIWAMKTVSCNMPLASCTDICSTFSAMFPGAMPEGFSLSPTKVKYLITDALAPFFRKKILEDAQSSNFTLMYDETTNAEGMKELQTAIRYWSPSRNEIVTHHLQTFFMGHATGEDLKMNILKALDDGNLSYSHLLMLGSDGPNVNRKVFRLINEEVKEVTGKALINIGSCNIHIIHNAFLKGLQKLGSNASELVLSTYYFLHGWPTRLEDFVNIQDLKAISKHKLLKHVTSRWLTLQPAVLRLLEQWEVVREYFLKHIPVNNSSLMDTPSYKKIAALLKRPTMKAELKFVCSSADLFQRFCRIFQKEEPLIHILHDEVKALVLVLMGRVCKKDSIKSFEEKLEGNPFKKENLLLVRQVECGEEVKAELAAATERDRLEFMLNVQNHFIAAGNHIFKKTPFGSNHLLHSFRCLQQSERCKKRSCKDILKIAKAMPMDIKSDELLDEWKLLQLEKLEAPEPENLQKVRIDKYWNQFFEMKDISGEPKYPNISAVVKASLALSHGSADVERGFSLSGRILTDERASMSERTLNAKLIVSDGLKLYRNKPELVPITKELLTLSRVAYKGYQHYLEEKNQAKKLTEKAKLEKEKNRLQEAEQLKKLEKGTKDISKMESELKLALQEQEKQSLTADKLFTEANRRLKKAIQKNDLQEAQVAQAMIEGVKSVREEEQNKRKKTKSIEKQLQKRKSTLIASFLEKKTKKS